MQFIPLQPSSTTKPYLESSATSTSTLAVIGAFECPAVGSSVFSSPLVELTTCKKNRAKGVENELALMTQLQINFTLRSILKHTFSLFCLSTFFIFYVHQVNILEQIQTTFLVYV